MDLIRDIFRIFAICLEYGSNKSKSESVNFSVVEENFEVYFMLSNAVWQKIEKMACGSSGRNMIVDMNVQLWRIPNLAKEDQQNKKGCLFSNEATLSNK